MLLDGNWKEISSGSVMIQKSSAGSISLVYANSLPSTEKGFTHTGVDTLVYPSVLGKALYGRSLSGQVDIPIEEVAKVSVDADITSSVPIETFTPSENSKGNVYTLVLEGLISSSEEEHICIRTSDIVISIASISIGSTSVESNIVLYENTDFVDGTGTLLRSFNRNRNFKDNPFPVDNAEGGGTVNNFGDVIEEFTVFGVAGSGSNKEVFTAQGADNALILEPNNGYAISITNSDSGERFYRVVLQLLIGGT